MEYYDYDNTILELLGKRLYKASICKEPTTAPLNSSSPDTDRGTLFCDLTLQISLTQPLPSLAPRTYPVLPCVRDNAKDSHFCWMVWQGENREFCHLAQYPRLLTSYPAGVLHRGNWRGLNFGRAHIKSSDGYNEITSIRNAQDNS